MLKIEIWTFMMQLRRVSVKDTLLLLTVTSLEGIRSDSEGAGFITVKVGGMSSLTTVRVTNPRYLRGGEPPQHYNLISGRKDFKI